MRLVMQIFAPVAAAPMGDPNARQGDEKYMPVMASPPHFVGAELELICRAVGAYIKQNPSITTAKSAQMKLEALSSAWRNRVRQS